MRLVIALGGNAMIGVDGSAGPQDQQVAIMTAMSAVADLVKAGHEIVLTHGNGPQVGNLLLKNELAAETVPPVPLDWCGAQTQATIVWRTLVAHDDPGFANLTTPIGRYASAEEASLMIEHGQHWVEVGDRGWGPRRHSRASTSRQPPP